MLKAIFMYFVLMNILFVFFLLNGLHALYVDPSYLERIFGMILSSASKNVFIIWFILYAQNKIVPNFGTWVKGVFILKLLNNLLVSYSLINLDFSLFQTTQFDKFIILSSFVFSSVGFLLSEYLHILSTHYSLKQIHHD